MLHPTYEEFRERVRRVVAHTPAAALPRAFPYYFNSAEPLPAPEPEYAWEADQLPHVLATYKVKNVSDLRAHQDEIVHLINWVLNYYNSYVRLRPSRIKGAGYGVFAVSRVSVDSGNVCTFGGIIMTNNVYAANAMEGGNEYVIDLADEMIMDGRTSFELWQVGRWCNGQPGKGWITDTPPNCVISVPKGASVLVHAKPIVDIDAGDEIYVDYGAKYPWHKLGYKRIFDLSSSPPPSLHASPKNKRRSGILMRRFQQDTIESKCVKCGAQAQAVCMGCERMYYCGNTCAKEHWETTHFANCK